MKKFNIADEFIPWDNSWCINIETGKDFNITHSRYISKFYDCYTCDECEKDATFTIVSDSYTVKPENSLNEHEFINIRSSKTGNIYRCLKK